jgi:hypothetical protein
MARVSWAGRKPPAQGSWLADAREEAAHAGGHRTGEQDGSNWGLPLKTGHRSHLEHRTINRTHIQRR